MVPISASVRQRRYHLMQRIRIFHLLSLLAERLPPNGKADYRRIVRCNNGWKRTQILCQISYYVLILSYLIVFLIKLKKYTYSAEHDSSDVAIIMDTNSYIIWIQIHIIYEKKIPNYLTEAYPRIDGRVGWGNLGFYA